MLRLQADTLFACGYGICAYSIDLGSSWKYSSVEGDNFIGLFQYNHKLLVCGENGAVWQREQGQQWHQISDNDHAFTQYRKYNKYLLLSNGELLRVGDKGLAGLSTDGGMHWKKLEGLPEDDLMSLAETNDHKIICVTKSGYVLSFSY